MNRTVQRMHGIAGIICAGIAIVPVGTVYPVVSYMTLYEYLQDTDVIAVGTIVDKEITPCNTYNHFDVHRIVYGDSTESPISIITLGGETLGGKGHWVEDEARYNEGDAYVVFLQEEPFSLSPTHSEQVRQGSYYTAFYQPCAVDTEFQAVMEAIEPLVGLKIEQDQESRVRRLLEMLTTENHHLVESAIIEVKKERIYEALPELLSLIQTGGYQIRFNCIEALRELGGDHAVKAILRALTDPSPGIRGRAAQSLGWMSAHEAETDLIAMVCDKGEEPDVRIDAVVALGCLRSAEALPYLEKVWQNEREKFSVFEDLYMWAIEEIRSPQKSDEEEHR